MQGTNACIFSTMKLHESLKYKNYGILPSNLNYSNVT